MWITEAMKKLRKGVKAGMIAMKVNNTLTDAKVVRLITDFRMSSAYNWMRIGDRYYQVDNDIKDRKITKKLSSGAVVEESYKANNKLAHAKYKMQVDEKIAYLLTKSVTYKTDEGERSDEYAKILKDVLGKHFQYQLKELGYEASNKGIAWIHVYIDEEGSLKTMVVPSEQCIPLWTDRTHTQLDTMIRVYETQVWEYDVRKTITNVEVWTKEGVTYYRLDGKMLIPDYEKNSDNDNGGPVAHYKLGDEWKFWGEVPFVAFKNNMVELPDIKFVKSLIDGYDVGRSEAANYVEEVKNLIYVLKGYGGQDISEFMWHLNNDRAIAIDDVEEGGVDTITPQMDITALREHYEQLKRDICEDGQSVLKDLDKFGSAPSGVALKFMYSGLDLKCNLMESEFKFGFEQLLGFVDHYLEFTGRGSFDNVEVEIIFSRDMTINETELIENCNNSKGTVSDETILAHHPYVSDVEDEKAKLEIQRKSQEPQWDHAPSIKGGEGSGEE